MICISLRYNALIAISIAFGSEQAGTVHSIVSTTVKKGFVWFAMGPKIHAIPQRVR